MGGGGGGGGEEGEVSKLQLATEGVSDVTCYIAGLLCQ